MEVIRPNFIEIKCLSRVALEGQYLCLAIDKIEHFYGIGDNKCKIFTGDGQSFEAFHSYEEIKEMINPKFITIVTEEELNPPIHFT